MFRQLCHMPTIAEQEDELQQKFYASLKSDLPIDMNDQRYARPYWSKSLNETNVAAENVTDGTASSNNKKGFWQKLWSFFKRLLNCQTPKNVAEIDNNDIPINNLNEERPHCSYAHLNDYDLYETCVDEEIVYPDCEQNDDFDRRLQIKLSSYNIPLSESETFIQLKETGNHDSKIVFGDDDDGEAKDTDEESRNVKKYVANLQDTNSELGVLTTPLPKKKKRKPEYRKYEISSGTSSDDSLRLHKERIDRLKKFEHSKKEKEKEKLEQKNQEEDEENKPKSKKLKAFNPGIIRINYFSGDENT